jgi:hypothetical protein
MKRIVAAAALIAASMSVQAADSLEEPVLRAFGRIKAHTQTGITLHDYTAALGEASMELEQYESAPGAKRPVAEELGHALGYYLAAQSRWELTRMSDENFVVYKGYQEKCPGLQADEQGRVFWQYITSCYWTHASEHIIAARKAAAAR